MKLSEIKDQLPPLIARNQINRWLGGVVAPGTLANLASRGLGPRYFKKGRKIFYLRDDLLRWLGENSRVVSTADQQWTDDVGNSSS